MSASTEGAPPLVWDGVSKSYKTHFWQRRKLSLDDLRLEVREGEILGLLGPNGAGKTTSIKLALGLIFPDSGRVRLMGRDASDPAARQRVSYLPESPYFPDDLTGRELVELAARLHGLPPAERKERANAMLERVGIGHAADRALRGYSKGMVQRAGMARALVSRPKLLILDEPMSGLDPIGRREFRDLILEQKRAGLTVLFASHVLSDAEMLCDRVAILRGGRLMACTDLARLAGERKMLHWEVEVRGGAPLAAAELVVTRGDSRLYRLPPDVTADEILDRVAAAGAELRALVPCRETLEDHFMRTLGTNVAAGARTGTPAEDEGTRGRPGDARAAR